MPDDDLGVDPANKARLRKYIRERQAGLTPDQTEAIAAMLYAELAEGGKGDRSDGCGEREQGGRTGC